MASRSNCPHVSVARKISVSDIEAFEKSKVVCSSCGVGEPNLWLCLNSKCLYVGCGESAHDHSLEHSQKSRHPLTMNLTTRRIWCYVCEIEVHKKANVPPFAFKDQSCSGSSFIAEPAERFNNPHLQTIQNDSDSDLDDSSQRPRGLTGLCNIGNTCYMNAAIQSLSNCPPLTRFFLDCPGYVASSKKSMLLSEGYMKLMSEMWHKKRPNYVIPSRLFNGIKQLHPMFRGYHQHDSQEFLRYLMDNLHEELKQAVVEIPEYKSNDHESSDEDNKYIVGQHPGNEVMVVSDTDYETCDSGLSSEHSSVALSSSGSSGENDAGEQVHGGPMDGKELSNEVNNDEADINNEQEMNKTSNNSVMCESERMMTDDFDAGDQKTMNCDEFDNFGKEELENVDLDVASVVTELQSIDTYETETKEEEIAESAPVKQKSVPPVQTFDDLVSAKRLKDNKEGGDKIGKGNSSANNSAGATSKRIPTHFSSVISDVFDGKILSSVQCMTCEQVSCTNETFQDLSLPIPNSDQVAVIRASTALGVGGSSIMSLQKSSFAELPSKKGWFSWMFGWMHGLFWGPVIKLQDCLAAFFSADDLKGDNMYSCEKCKKLRNGVKYSKVLKLPEILCVHLKRFRHEYMFSSKISSFVSFPLERLDMQPYLHKDCKDTVTTYNLVAVICHHGTAGGGHYTTYALNYVNETWYEFDDQVVTEVDLQQVENCEAYVLFYRKQDDQMVPLRVKANQITESDDNGFFKFFISRQWICKFNTFAEPGPINNYDFLCRHGAVQPKRFANVTDLVADVPPVLWEFLHSTFGGGPAVNHLTQCNICLQELERLKRRQQQEMDVFLQLHEEFIRGDSQGPVLAISMSWFREWESFVRGKSDEPPGPVDNGKICVIRNGAAVLLMNSDYGQMSEDIWHFFYGIYGGGPLVMLKQGMVHKNEDSSDARSGDKQRSS